MKKGEFDLDADGNVIVHHLVGFQTELVAGVSIVLQLTCEAPGPIGQMRNVRHQVFLTAEKVQDLAASLARAVEEIRSRQAGRTLN